MPEPIPTSPLTTEAIAGLYRLDEIEGWQLLLRHFELADDVFAFLVVLAPDDWGVAVVRERFAKDVYPEPAALVRVRFEPDREPEALASALIGMKSVPTLRAVWIDADPADPDHLADRDEQWKRSLGVLNRYRNALQTQFRCPLVLAVPARIEPILREAAPDLWAVRSGVCRVESAEASTALLRQLPPDEWKPLWDEPDDLGDPRETLSQAEKLRGKPGRELLLARLLLRAGEKARSGFEWQIAEKALSEAYQIQTTVGGDFLLRWKIAMELAHLFTASARFDRAEYYARIALETAEENIGMEAIPTAVSLNALADLLRTRNRLPEAESLYRRAIHIEEVQHLQDSQSRALLANKLGDVCRARGRLAEAETLVRKALSIDEKVSGEESPDVAADLNNLAQLLEATNRISEAESLYRRSLAIAEAHHGPDHPHTATVLNNLGMLFRTTGRLDEAETFSRRALAIDEAIYGGTHPRVATDLNNLGMVLAAMGRRSEAEALLRRALAIDETAFGLTHRRVATGWNNLAMLLIEAGQYVEAEPLLRRSVAISAICRQIGECTIHENVLGKNYLDLLVRQGFTRQKASQALKRVEKNAAKELGLAAEAAQVQ